MDEMSVLVTRRLCGPLHTQRHKGIKNFFTPYSHFLGDDFDQDEEYPKMILLLG